MSVDTDSFSATTDGFPMPPEFEPLLLAAEHDQNPELSLLKRFVGRIALTEATMRPYYLRTIGALFPVFLSAAAIGHGSPQDVDIAGKHVGVKAVIGQQNVNFGGSDFRDAAIAPLYKHLAPGIDIGLNIDTDVNGLFPKDKQQRALMSQLAQNPEAEIARINDAAGNYLLLWGVGGFATGLAVDAAAWGVLRRQRRKFSLETPENQQVIRRYNTLPRRAEAALATGVVAVVFAAGAQTLTYTDHRELHADPLLANTPFAGTEVNGAAKEVLPILLSFSPAQARFYKTASENVRQLILNDPWFLERQTGDTLWLFADDVESVSGMYQAFGVAGKTMQANRLMLTGDATWSGQPIETYQLDYPGYWSDGIPMEFALGHHDLDATKEAAEARDYITVADNRTHTYDDIKLLALNDPRYTTVSSFGTTEPLRDPEVSVDDFIQSAVQEICATEPVVMGHDYQLMRKIIAAAQAEGCTLPLVMDGRSYRTLGVQEHVSADGLSTVEYTSGSAGGHTADDGFNPGIIQSPATLTAVKINMDNGTVEIKSITINTDATATAGDTISQYLQLSPTAKGDASQPGRVNALSDAGATPKGGRN